MAFIPKPPGLKKQQVAWVYNAVHSS